MQFKVHLLEQDCVLVVDDQQTILAAALQQGISLPYGCRNGQCGACKAQVQSGDYHYPNYLDNALPEGISQQEHTLANALLCQATAKSDLVIKARTIETTTQIKPEQFPCRVVHFEKLNNSVIQLKLELPKTKRLQFLAGQYIDILLREGKRRSFSLANPPHEDQLLELHIQYYKDGLFSEYAAHDLKQKTVLRIEGPFGQFTLQQSERPILMIAGGTGFAPIKSLVEQALKNNDQRNITIYWGAKTEADLYLDTLVTKWTKEHEQIHYRPVLSELETLNHWEGRTGFVHEAVLADYANLSDYDVYACGPPPMVNAIIQSLPKQGLNKDRLFSDAFEFAPK